MVATLQILKGANQGQQVALAGDRMVLGRNPDCHVVIPVTSVSREHAHILRVQDRFYIEDMQSRNGTFVNNQPITARTQLKHNDRIRICDFVAAFCNPSELPPLPAELTRPKPEEEDEPPDSPTTVEATLSHSSGLLLETQPAEKLRVLLDISGSLSKTLDLEPLWPKVVESLFQVFRQADRCFLILGEEGSGRLIPKVIRTRRPQDEANARFSRSIVKRALETSQAFLSDDASNDKNLPLSQSVVDFRIRSVMIAPLCTAEGKAFGVIQLDTQDRSKKFTQDDLKLLVGVADQAAIALENARLHQSRVEQEKARRDMEIAHQVQFSFLPSRLPQVPGYEFYAHYEPALEVGGDYYDFLPLPGQRLAALVADVAGKGVPAALLMAKLYGDARYCLLTQDDPSAALAKLNDVLTAHLGDMDRFITFAGAILDPAAHELTLVNAGHLPPLIYRRAAGTLEECEGKDIAGVPLGVLEDQTYPSCRVRLEPGDSLVLFTDGVPDAYNARGDSFNPEGVYRAVWGAGPLTPAQVGERILKALKQHVAGFARHDDVTLVCLGRVS